MKNEKLDQNQNISIRVHAFIEGAVQGVGYRWFVRQAAQRFGLSGWVRNLDNGGVELEVEGPKEEVDEFLEKIQREHQWARVENIRTDKIKTIDDRSGFEIV